MTKEEFFNKLQEGPLFKAIDQTTNVTDFLLTRTAAYTAIDESEELQELQKRKQQYEAEFETGDCQNLPEYLKVIEEMDLESQFLYFQQGFFEGAKFIFVLGQFSIMSESYLEYLDTLQGK